MVGMNINLERLVTSRSLEQDETPRKFAKCHISSRIGLSTGASEPAHSDSPVRISYPTAWVRLDLYPMS